MKLDHFAYLVRDTDAAIAAMPFADAKVTVYRHALQSQRAYITFVQTAPDAPLTELVEPFAENSAMQRRLDKEGAQSALYHVGYTVTTFDDTFAEMRRAGWVPPTKPFEGMTPGCRASHLFNPSFGMVEIMEVTA